MRNLYLHIGHFKTGSTWIQNILRLNRQALLDHSLYYPLPGAEEADSTTFAASGNAESLFTERQNLNKLLSEVEPDKHLVLSSEFAFPHMINEQELARLVDGAKKAGYNKVELLLLIRNPISLLISGWIQAVKNSGETESINSVVNNPSFRYYKTPQDVARLIELAEQHPMINLKVRNYSACRDKLIDVVKDWLDIEYTFQHLSTDTVVNRSLTSGEMLFQRVLNANLGACGNLCGVPLVEKLPNIRSSKVIPDIEEQTKYINRMRPYIDKVNEKVEEAHRYQLDLIENSAEPDEPILNADQIKVIAGSVGERIRLERDDPAHLSTGQLVKLVGKRVLKRFYNMFKI